MAGVGVRGRASTVFGCHIWSRVRPVARSYLAPSLIEILASMVLLIHRCHHTLHMHRTGGLINLSMRVLSGIADMKAPCLFLVCMV